MTRYALGWACFHIYCSTPMRVLHWIQRHRRIEHALLPHAGYYAHHPRQAQ